MNDDALMRCALSARGRVTLATIAAATGVSRATVSLVLRESPLVASATRERVQAELARQGYVYHRAAADLRRRRSSCVALVINDLSNPFFAEFAAGVAEALEEAGLATLLGSCGESPQRQQAVLASLQQHAPAAFIVSPAQGSELADLRASLPRTRNVLLFNRDLVEREWDLLTLDNQVGAALATRHLLALGHRDIVFFGEHDGGACHARCAGYREQMIAAGLTPRVVPASPLRPESMRVAEQMLQAGDHTVPSAVVCYNDNTALGVMAAVSARGLRAGVDVAVTGFDDIAEASLVTPALTTLCAEPRLRGQQAAAMVLQRLQTPDAPPRSITAAVELRVRGSSGGPRQQLVKASLFPSGANTAPPSFSPRAIS